ncbi:MAG: prepilin-type N-terminal cleavage/methylation domain-containing protein [Acidobacteriota bacterium]
METNSNNESGFTLIEVTIASLITLMGLIFLAGLFTLAISQNRLVKQYTSTTLLAQEKIEELNAVENNDNRLKPGGNLTTAATANGINYYDSVYVDDSGQVTTIIPQGQAPNYKRYWLIQSDPQLKNSVIISVRVVSMQPGRNLKKFEETTLATVRSW